MFMDMVERMEASLSQMGRTAKLQAPTQTRSGRIPKEWVKFTGDPATIVKEYQDYERQAYRANFRTWREFFDQFEECHDSHLSQFGRINGGGTHKTE